MSFENTTTDTGGDASAGTSTAAPDNSGGEIASGGQDASPAIPAIFEGGVDNANAAPSLTTQPVVEGQEPAQPAEPDDGDATEAELNAALADPNTPQWARTKIEQAMAYSGKLKAAKLAAEEQANTYRAQYEGKEVLPQPDIERMRAAEDKVFALQSVTATPESIEQTLRELNPRAYQGFQNHLVWNALEQPDGTPNLNNLQAIVDRFSGEQGSVKAADVIGAMNALKAGVIGPEDFHEFQNAEEYQAFQKQQEREKGLSERQSQIEQNAKFQETQIRTGELKQVVSSFQTQMESQITPLLEKFKLTPVPNEPKAASDFKARVTERIAQVVTSAPAEIRELGEIVKAIEILKQATGADAQTAVNEIKSFMNSPAYQQHVAKGLSSLVAKVEAVVSQDAYYYKLLMQGLEVENSKGGTARPVIGAPNQSANLPPLTEADLAKMSSVERADHAALALTAELRSQKYGASRTGQ